MNHEFVIVLPSPVVCSSLDLRCRPDPSILHRNRCFLEMCLGHKNMAKLHRQVDDLMKLDTGPWNSPHIYHHCKGLFCCRSIDETRAKLFNAIVVPWLTSDNVSVLLPASWISLWWTNQSIQSCVCGISLYCNLKFEIELDEIKSKIVNLQIANQYKYYCILYMIN